MGEIPPDGSPGGTSPIPSAQTRVELPGKVGLLAARSQEADGNGDRARKLQRELESTRRDAEGMLTVSSIAVFLPKVHTSMILLYKLADAAWHGILPAFFRYPDAGNITGNNSSK